MAGIDPKNLTPEQKRQAIGQCNFFWLYLLSTAAFVCGLVATCFCSFVKRNIEFVSDSTTLCYAVGLNGTQCSAMTQNHGVGFFGWQTTVPVNQFACMSYTQYIPSMFLVSAM